MTVIKHLVHILWLISVFSLSSAQAETGSQGDSSVNTLSNMDVLGSLEALNESVYVDTTSEENLELTARQIMEAAHDVDMGDYVKQNITMRITGKKGSERVLQVTSFRKYSGDDNKDLFSVMFFISPSKLKNTAFLSHDYKDDSKRDKQWMYLPAIRKTRLVAAQGKSQSFMNTDFSYADLMLRNTGDYEYKILGEELYRDQAVWIVQADPINPLEIKETGYTQSIIYVRKDNFVIVKNRNSLKRAGRTKLMEVEVLDLIDGIWVPTRLTMTTFKENFLLTKTTMIVENIQFNQDIPDQLFSKNKLKFGF